MWLNKQRTHIEIYYKARRRTGLPGHQWEFLRSYWWWIR